MPGESHSGYDRKTGKINAGAVFDEIDHSRFGVLDLPYGTAVLNRIDTDTYREKLFGNGGGFCHETILDRDRARRLFGLAVKHSKGEGSGVEIKDYTDLRGSFQ